MRDQQQSRDSEQGASAAPRGMHGKLMGQARQHERADNAAHQVGQGHARQVLRCFKCK